MSGQEKIFSSELSTTDDVQRYRYLSDAACKQFLSDKLILACILKECVSEFKDCDVNDIENKYIEGEPEVGTVGVHPETTNSRMTGEGGGKIHGMQNESTSDTEGKVTFDIRFYAMTPAKERVKLIINIEAQNAFYPGYPLIKRAIYYGCRQISAQYGSEFEHAHYENIKKVYSIWICFDPPKNRRNTITLYDFAEKQLVGNVHEIIEHYDLMCIVMICLGTSKDERYTGLLKLLGVFMSEAADMMIKTQVLKSEFGANLPKRLQDKEVKMCTYSEFIENRGIKKGIQEGRKEGRKESKAEDLLNLMRNFKLSIDQALTGLSIPENEWEEYRALVAQIQSQAVQS